MHRPLALLLAACLACTSTSPDAPSYAGEARVAIEATVPAGAVDGPLLLPAELRVTATPPDARGPVTIVLPMAARAAHGELRLARRLAAERWRFRGAAAVGGDTLFRVVEDLTLRTDAPRPELALRLRYDGRDAALARLALLPRDTTVEAGLTLDILVRAEDPLGLIFPPPLGWRTRDASVARVDATGRVTAVAAGATWIVGRSWTGLADSMRVTVR